LKASSGAVWKPAGVATMALRGSSGARLQAAGQASALLFSAGGTRWIATYSSSAQFVGSTALDAMLSDEDAQIIYFAEIEPWILTDRS
jgi:hypothetical protein